jgi:hypothetical protein
MLRPSIPLAPVIRIRFILKGCAMEGVVVCAVVLVNNTVVISCYSWVMHPILIIIYVSCFYEL